MGRRARPSLVTLSLACSLSTAGALAQTSHPLPEYTRRPFVLPAGQLIGRVGFGLARSSATVSRAVTEALGGGLHGELIVGLGRALEVTAGTGVRAGNDGELLAADRYARVDQEEVFQTGNRVIGNPYVRLRWGILEPAERVVHVGVETTLVFPVASQTAWSVGAGVPLLVTLPVAHMRVETGLFWQFILSSTAGTRNVLNVPLRVMFQLGSRVALGVVTGVYAGNVGRDDATDPRVPLGVQAAFRVAASTDLLLQWVYPTVAPFGADATGVGITIAGRML